MKEKMNAIWSWLTEPSTFLHDPLSRSKVRLLLTLMAILMPLGIVGIIIPLVAKPVPLREQIPLLLIVLTLSVFLFIAYLISRTQYYQYAVYFALVVSIVAILAIARVDDTPDYLNVLYYVLILVQACTLFFSIRVAVIITAIALAIILSVPLFVPNTSLYSIIIGPFNLVLLASVANLLIANFRDQLEKSRYQHQLQLLHELALRAAQLSALQETSLDIASHRDINELLKAIVTRAVKLLNVAGGSIFLINPDNATLTLTAVIGPGAELQNAQFDFSEGMVGQVLATGQPLTISDYDQWAGRSTRIPKNLVSSIVQVPIKSLDIVIGVLGCQEAAGVQRTFTDDDIQLLDGLARQSAIAIENAYLFKEEQAARERAERLQAATQAISSSLVLQDVFEIILVELQKVVPYNSATVQQLKSPNSLEIIGGHGFPNLDSLLGINFDLTADDNPNREVIATRSPIILEDAPTAYSGFRSEPHDKTIIHSWLGVPLLFGNQIIGMLALDKHETGYYTQEHAALASAFAAQAAVAIENARLYEEASQRALELQTLAQISASLRTVKTVDEMLPILLQKTVEATGATYSVLFLTDQETGELVSRLSVPPDYYRIGLRQKPGVGITGHVAAKGEIHVSDDIDNEPLLSLIPGEQESFQGTKSAVSVPLETSDRSIGVLHIASIKKGDFTEVDIRLVSAVSDIAANAINRATVMETLEERVNERTQELAQANLRLKDLDKLKSKFISDVSHELRTPVATLNLYMDLLVRGKPEKQHKYTNILRQKIDLLVRLTEDILNVSRLNLYEQELKFSAVNLNDTIKIVIAMLNERAQASDLEMTFSPALNLPLIRAERNQLIQAITNVIANALNFTTEGSVKISTFLLAESRQACLKITDSGIGITQEELPHIFDRFYRGHHVAQLNLPGTGLGLAITKEIIDLHNGSIEVDSTPGQGSTFFIYWPLADGLLAE